MSLRTIQPNRRGFLAVGALTGLGLTLGDFFRLEKARGEQKNYDFIEAKAKSVIHIFLPGGIAHQETFDPKPYAPIEYRAELPVWRADFGGSDNLSVFVAADTGRVAARRSDLWRVYDFLWSLHIMDYRERENFNHPLLIAFSVGALAMSLFGLILLFIRLPPRLRTR